jgi:hypothetical protein
MARPRTTSKPRPKRKKQAEPEREVINVNGYTGMQVPEAKAKAIAAAHIAGMPSTQICKAFNCNWQTVMAIVRNRPELLDKAREITGRNWKTLAAVGTAELIDRIPDMRNHELTIMSAVSTEKSELLSGGATQRVEHVMAPAADAWASFVSGLKSEQVIDVAFEPVGAQEPGGQKDAPALPDAPITPDRDSAGVDDQHVTL